MKTLLSILTLVLCLGVATSGFATESEEYAQKGRLVFSAFECATYAENMNNPKEQERLFILGYQAGLDFIEALKANKIKQEDLNNNVPMMGVLMLLQGPTDDFMLSRIFESASRHAYDKIFGSPEKPNSVESMKIIIENKFREGNCKLL